MHQQPNNTPPLLPPFSPGNFETFDYTRVNTLRDALDHFQISTSNGVRYYIVNDEISFSLKTRAMCRRHIPLCPKKVVWNHIEVRPELRRTGVFSRYFREFLNGDWCMSIGQPSDEMIGIIVNMGDEVAGLMGDLETGLSPYMMRAQILPQLDIANMTFRERLRVARLSPDEQRDYIRQQQQQPQQRHEFRYPRPPVVSGPLFPEEENMHWLRLKYRADAFAVAANRDVAERLEINEALAVRDSKRSQAGPADYTDEQNRARERAIAPASSSTAIRTASARNRLGPSPLIPLRNVTARERDSGLEMCAVCFENMGSSTLIQPAGTHFGCGHTICVNCTQAARLRKCPYCREPSKIDPLPRGPRADFLFSHC
jgi:hypothetical protein